MPSPIQAAPARQGIVFRLGVAQALYLASAAIAFTFSGLVGARLAPDASLATLPVALMTVATMLVTVPASLLMERFGRRPGFVTGAAMGLLGACLSSWAVIEQSFALFCAGNALLGAYQAFAMYYRFAAADAVDESSKGRAVGWVLTGGVVAALLGPSLATWSRPAFPVAEFAGSYAAAAALSLLAIAVVSTLNLPPAAKAAAEGERRTLSLIARQPVFIVAVVNAVVAYSVMSFVMTASPLAVVATGHGVDAAASLTRWHLLGMFAPSFITGRIVSSLGPLPVLLAGGALLLISLLGPLTGDSAAHFNIALFMLGIGWNFLYVAATTLLTESYRPSERARVQGLNEFLVFGSTAVASLAAGAAQTSLGWTAVNQVAAPFVLVALIASLWLAARRRTAAQRSPAPAEL